MFKMGGRRSPSKPMNFGEADEGEEQVMKLKAKKLSVMDRLKLEKEAEKDKNKKMLAEKEKEKASGNLFALAELDQADLEALEKTKVKANAPTGRIRFEGIVAEDKKAPELLCEECEKVFSVVRCQGCDQLFCSSCADLCHQRSEGGKVLHPHEVYNYIRPIEVGDVSRVFVDKTFYMPAYEFLETEIAKVKGKDLSIPNTLAVNTKDNNVVKTKQSFDAPRFNVDDKVIFTDPESAQMAYGRVISEWDFRHGPVTPTVVRGDRSAVWYVVEMIDVVLNIHGMNEIVKLGAVKAKTIRYPKLSGVQDIPHRHDFYAARVINHKIDAMHIIQEFGPRNHFRPEPKLKTIGINGGKDEGDNEEEDDDTEEDNNGDTNSPSKMPFIAGAIRTAVVESAAAFNKRNAKKNKQKEKLQPIQASSGASVVSFLMGSYANNDESNNKKKNKKSNRDRDQDRRSEGSGSPSPPSSPKNRNRKNKGFGGGTTSDGDDDDDSSVHSNVTTGTSATAAATDAQAHEAKFNLPPPPVESSARRFFHALAEAVRPSSTALNAHLLNSKGKRLDRSGVDPDRAKRILVFAEADLRRPDEAHNVMKTADLSIKVKLLSRIIDATIERMQKYAFMFWKHNLKFLEKRRKENAARKIQTIARRYLCRVSSILLFPPSLPFFVLQKFLLT